MTRLDHSKPYVPNPALRVLYERVFDKIQVDEDWAQRVRDLESRGTVIYVLRNLNFVDFLALDHLTKRYHLPRIHYVNDLGLWILNPLGKGWLNALWPRQSLSSSEELQRALSDGGTAALFLKRPPGVLDVASGASGGRGLKEGDELVQTLFELQRTRSKPLLLLPLVFVWSKSPDTRGTQPLDFILGPREWPSPARTLGQFLYNYKHVALRLGEPIDVKEFLRGSEGLGDEVLVRRLTYAMLRRLERERRSITGPAAKSPDRVRSELIRSPKLRGIIDDLAGTRANERAALTRRALDMLRELQATPELGTLKGLEVVFDRVFHRIYGGIEYDRADMERLRAAAREGSLILLPSHKSHIDYLILSYVFNELNLPLPLIAAGENLNFFPVGPIFRRGGAFFIRRSFKGDRLYAAVVDAYIRRLIRDGFPIELFLEGGRSRTGKLLPPKFGLLNMIVDAALGVPQHRTFIVPVSIGYERVIEAGAFQRELSGAEKKKEEAADLLRTGEVLRHRYGRMNIQIGTILSLEELCHEVGISIEEAQRPAKRRNLVTRLGNRVMDEINRVTSVTPGSLTALALLSYEQRGLEHEELVGRCRRLLSVLQSLGARISPTVQTPSGALRPEAIREAAQMFLDAELIESYAPSSTDLPPPDSLLRRFRRRPRPSYPARSGTLYAPIENKRLALDTSKNIIVHFFVERALIAIAVLTVPGPPSPVAAVRQRVQKLSRLFKHEFRFRADAPFEEIFSQTLDAMAEAGHVQVDAEMITPGVGSDSWSGAEWLDAYASILKNFLESYRITIRALEYLLTEPLAQKDLVKKCLALGNRMFLGGDVSRRECISKPVFENALAALTDLRVLRTRYNRLELSDAYNSAEALQRLEARLARYLGETSAVDDATEELL